MTTETISLDADAVSNSTDPAPRSCQFEDPRTSKECSADSGPIFRVGIVDRGVASDPIDVCGLHLPAVIVTPPGAYDAVWAVMIAQDIT